MPWDRSESRLQSSSALRTPKNAMSSVRMQSSFFLCPENVVHYRQSVSHLLVGHYVTTCSSAIIVLHHHAAWICFSQPCLFPHLTLCVYVCVCVCVCVCVSVISVIVKRLVLPPCVVDGHSRNHLYYYYITDWVFLGCWDCLWDCFLEVVAPAVQILLAGERVKERRCHWWQMGSTACQRVALCWSCSVGEKYASEMLIFYLFLQVKCSSFFFSFYKWNDHVWPFL